MFTSNLANYYKKEAEDKHPDWPSDLIHAAGVIVEELGELMQACLQYRNEGGSKHRIIKEAYHTLVTSARFIENFQPSESLTEEWPDSELVKIVGFDDCVVGVVERMGQEPVLCYNRDKVITRLVDQGMSVDEAEEYFEFNIAGAWMGGETPCFIDFGELEEE